MNNRIRHLLLFIRGLNLGTNILPELLVVHRQCPETIRVGLLRLARFDEVSQLLALARRCCRDTEDGRLPLSNSQYSNMTWGWSIHECSDIFPLLPLLWTSRCFAARLPTGETRPVFQLDPRLPTFICTMSLAAAIHAGEIRTCARLSLIHI